MNQPQIVSSAPLGSRLVLAALLASSLFGALCLLAPQEACAQLPPVNMGRWVKQPGDNQYTNETQQSRHGAPAPVMAAPVNIPLSSPGWRPTPKPYRPDISLDAIVCDEPLAPSGFPPVPDNLDLPGLRGSSLMRPGAMGGGGGYGGGGSFSPSYGGVQVGGPGGNRGIEVRSSQGYVGVTPGAFVQKKTPYGASANNSGPTRGGNGGGGDVYSSGDGAPARRNSAAMSELQRLGKEPSLDDKGRSAAPEAPEAVQINQSSTQDLSLPDDEYQTSGKKSQSQAGKIFSRTAGRMGNRLINGINCMPLPIKMPGMH